MRWNRLPRRMQCGCIQDYEYEDGASKNACSNAGVFYMQIYGKRILTNISHCDTIEYIEVRYIEVRYTDWGGKESGIEKNKQSMGNKSVRGRNYDIDIGRIEFCRGEAAGYSVKNHRGAGLDCTFYTVIFYSQKIHEKGLGKKQAWKNI